MAFSAVEFSPVLIQPYLRLSPPLSTRSTRAGGGVTREATAPGDFRDAVLVVFADVVDAFFEAAAGFDGVRRRFLPAAAVVFSAGMFLYLVYGLIEQRLDFTEVPGRLGYRIIENVYARLCWLLIDG